MAYRYPSVLPGGDCGAGACSSNSRPCTPNKKIIKTLTVDFETDPSLANRYVVQTGAERGFFFASLIPTGPGGVVPQGSLIPSSANLISAQYSDSSIGKTTEGARFSARAIRNATGAPAGFSAISFVSPSGSAAAAQRANGPTGTFVVYYI
jgi:hypothetical protein